MVIFMNMASGERLDEGAPAPYGEEVLNANLLPPELALGLQEVSAGSHATSRPVPMDVDAFMAAVYRYQE